jgi:protein-S-isoprenylcysteine O-methyltransferase Ste14
METARSYGPLSTAMVREGNWLFRRRSWLPLTLALLVYPAVVLGPRFTPEQWDRWELVALLVALAGLVVRFLVAGFVPKGTSGRNIEGQEAAALNTTGLYTLVRHPLYLGNFLMWLGVVLLAAHGWLAVVFTLLFWIYVERVMAAEEAYLEERFGEDFRAWAARTPAFLPRRLRWESPPLGFSLRIMLRREFSGIYALIAAFTSVDVLRNLTGEADYLLDPLRAGLFWGGTLFYLLMVFLKRKTRLLKVPGR